MRKLSRIKIKKKTVFLFLLLFIIFLYGIFRSKNYEVEYKVNDVEVQEKFIKKEKLYEFLFKTNDKEFFVRIPHSYIHTKKFISEIVIKEKEETTCLLLKSNKLNLSPLCIQNNEYISYHLIEDEDLIPSSYQKEISYEEKTYKNMTLYSLNDKKYYIWNYVGFDVLSSKEQKEIPLFKEDAYSIPLAIQTSSYVVIADYDSQYNFQKFYILNSKNDKVKELVLEKEISFDSYFPGTYSNKVYLVDKKNLKEYEINPKHLTITNITKNNQGRIFNGDEWVKINMNVLTNNKTLFTNKNNTTYELKDNILYQVQENYKTKISNYKVKEIVYSDQDAVYYLVEDKLYSYNTSDGEALVLRNTEWNFNYENMIYIF